MEIPYKLEALAREKKVCKVKREMMRAILRLEETSAVSSRMLLRNSSNLYRNSS
jgi:hypothetical protein